MLNNNNSLGYLISLDRVSVVKIMTCTVDYKYFIISLFRRSDQTFYNLDMPNKVHFLLIIHFILIIIPNIFNQHNLFRSATVETVPAVLQTNVINCRFKCYEIEYI